MKLSTSIPEQIELLKSRNLIFENEEKAAQFLFKNNYYRLSVYWRKYQINPDKDESDFVNKTTFEQIVAIYELDTLLRNLVNRGIGIFEICFRSRFAYHIANSDPNGQFLYLKPNSYNNKVSEEEKPETLLEKIKKEAERSNEKITEYYKEKNENIPICMAIELLSFSTVSRMYSRWANKKVVKNVSSDFKILRNYESSKHIIRSLVVLRNFCAHQVRIWNRKVVERIINKEYLQNFGDSEERSQWRVISVLMSLVDEINHNNQYSHDVLELCKQNEEFYKGLIEPTL